MDFQSVDICANAVFLTSQDIVPDNYWPYSDAPFKGRGKANAGFLALPLMVTPEFALVLIDKGGAAGIYKGFNAIMTLITLPLINFPILLILSE